MQPHFDLPSPEEYIDQDFLPIELYVKREDLIHPLIKGNKFRKLKYNIIELQKSKILGFITFGGAYSNHLHASAACGKLYGMKTVGIIRADEKITNDVLKFCMNMDMKLHFVSRASYKTKEYDNEIQEIINMYTDYAIIPEGGSNKFALIGVQELVNEFTKYYDYIIVAAGTGYTAAGIIREIYNKGLQSITIVISALKGAWMRKVIDDLTECQNINYLVTDEFCQGGYAKVNTLYLEKLKFYKSKLKVPIDHVYNGKLIFGMEQLCLSGIIKKGSKVLWINTGGVLNSIY
jgi:1-aminocyclopropane-1-carboxylate deaminase